MTNDYDGAVRRMLVEQVEATRLVSAPSRRRMITTSILSFALAGALAGGAVSAFASGGGDESGQAAQTSFVVDYPPADNLGRDIVYSGQSIAYVGTGSDEIIVADRPADATSLYFVVQCLSPGEFSFELRGRSADPVYGTTCMEEYFDPTDLSDPVGFFLDDVTAVQYAVDVTTTPEAKWRVTLSWIRQNPWPTNDAGQTYGLPWGHEVNPDLIAVDGVNADGGAVQGYVRRSEYEQGWDAAIRPPESTIDIPLVASDGVTTLGTHRVGNPPPDGE
ncbi:MAG: hypothetical protein ACOH1T_11315 [Microbacteriaceae bacterium]